ncbi:cation:proton antiporter [Marinobacterium arenosum]|uniref:cation:proton antiporter n=1 Tax=Marinobacterium arenosum TaxID=2862496 RepID=UPI001C988EDA|nr:cation:proton antiporter [Marinobacterium arenosum]MBY4676092.1 cation:proton antiporter [Marinobacterium arenosum]
MHHFTTSIEFQMSLLLFVALAGYLLATRIGQPAVVGEILLGLAVGPSLFGWITYTDFVASIAHLGAIVLLFVIGLEFSLRELLDKRYALIALFGVLVPWAGGYLLASGFGAELQQALLISVALTATSIAITADTLRELGQLQTPAARAVIGAAVIDDILALLALAMVTQVSAGELSAFNLMVMVLKATLFLVAGVLFGRYLVVPAIGRIDRSAMASRYPELVFIFTMMVAFLYAMVSEQMGLSAIVGAFIAGMTLEGVKTGISKQFKEGAEYLRILFGAVFFVSLGILADLRTFTLETLWFVLALTAVAIVSKVVGCSLPALLTGMSRNDALIVGFGMAPRGEVAMVVALLALNQGVIDQPTYVALVMMSLLTTLAVPLVLRNWLCRPA